MNEDTVQLLKECTSGCDMAIESMHQVEGIAEDPDLKSVIAKYKEAHEKIKAEAEELLRREGHEPKEPGKMASAFSWFTTEMKLMMENDSHQIGKLMMDGCNMGIQSISEHRNQFEEAEEEAQDLAGKLVKAEEDFMEDMRVFL